jgi:hypothetical protein
LQKSASSSDRVAANWYGTTIDTEVNHTDGQAHRVSIYLLDWDAIGRVVGIDAINPVNGAVLDTRTVSNFSGGQYLSWNITGRMVLRVRLVSGVNAVYSGLFFDSAAASPAPPPVGTTATFKATDSVTRGNWKGVYGTGGYMLANDGTSIPSYAVVTQPSPFTWTWSSSTTDGRALQKAAATDRIAATWYGGTMDIDVTINDGRSHDLSLYLLDWDSASRFETVQLLDAVTKTVLDTRSVSGFNGGQYWTWTVSGHVIARVSLVSGVNAVYSGVFFDR